MAARKRKPASKLAILCEKLRDEKAKADRLILLLRARDSVRDQEFTLLRDKLRDEAKADQARDSIRDREAARVARMDKYNRAARVSSSASRISGELVVKTADYSDKNLQEIARVACRLASLIEFRTSKSVGLE